MKQRIITASVLILIVTIAFLSRFLLVEIFDVLIGILLIAATLEMVNLFKNMGKKTHDKASMLYPIFFYLLFVISITFNMDYYWIILIEIVGLFLYSLGLYLFMLAVDAKDKTNIVYGSNKKEIIRNNLFIAIYPGFMLGSLLFLNNIELLVANAVEIPLLSMVMLLLPILITVLTDTLAYFVGSALKGPKIAPKISPKKGYYGAIGGLFGGILGGIIMFFIISWIPALKPILTFFDLKIWVFIILGFCGSLISQVGDFFESYIKRKANVKDSGTLLPGHGGILDRVDALILNAPFICLIMLLIL